jgi:Cof subfamily protein (haloacid dehalogenase superfamily)
LKLFVSDLDGTLLNNQQRLSEDTIQIINRLMSRGMCFSIATARSISSAWRIIEPLELRQPLIIHNGVFLYDPVKKEYILSNFMDNAVTKAIMKEFSGCGIKPFVFTRDGTGEFKVYFEILQNKGQQEYYEDRVKKGDKRFTQVKDIRSHLDEQIITLVAIGSKESLQGCYERIRDSYEVHTNFSEDIYTREYWLELTHSKANKRDAVLALKEMLRADELICFGDNINDLPMFEVADLSLAVENAHEDVKRAANSTIAGNEKNGVACFLQEYIVEPMISR